MFLTQDQIPAAAKANLEAQLALYSSLTNKTLESVGKLITLNLTAAKASMEESSIITQQLLAAKDPKEVVSLFGSLIKPSIEKAVAYSTHVSNIASSAQAELNKAAEAQVAEVRRTASELFGDAVKTVPAGSESLAAFMRSMLNNLNAGYEQFAKAGRQATETAEAAAESTVVQFTQSAQPAQPAEAAAAQKATGAAKS